MSYIFEIEDKGLWAPSNIVAGIFLSQLENLAELVDVGTGFEETMGGVVRVNPQQLGDFLAATARYLKKCDNPSLKALLRPVIVHLIAIFSRCERASPNVDFTSFEHDWVVESDLLAEKGMPR